MAASKTKKSTTQAKKQKSNPKSKVDDVKIKEDTNKKTTKSKKSTTEVKKPTTQQKKNSTDKTTQEVKSKVDKTVNVKYKTGKQVKDEIIDLLVKEAARRYNSPDKFDKLKVNGISLSLQIISGVNTKKEN